MKLRSLLLAVWTFVLPAALFAYDSTVTKDLAGNFLTGLEFSDTVSANATYVMAAPTASTVSPSAGPAAGGTSVTISGSGLTGATGVTFGGTAGTSVVVVDSNTITVTAPAKTAGALTVVVQSPFGDVTLTNAYTYYDVPTITGISPTSGPTGGGTTVAITGTNLLGATGVTAVKFGSNNATSYTVNSGTSITATAPAGTGTIDVRVTTPGGTTAISAADQFTYVPAPVITSISPTAGPTSGGTSVVITGSNFTGVTAVTFGGTSSTFTFNSGTQITATAPAGSGTVDVRVTTAGGTSATSAADQFTYVAAPVVTSISPTAGPTGGATSVIITGNNFTGVTAVVFGGTAASTFTFNSSTQITAVAPAGSGTVDVRVTTAGGTSATSAADQYTYVAAPTITSISPTSGGLGGGTSVVLTGTNFSGATSVNFGANSATGVVVDSATQIRVTSPSGSAGTVDITVTTVGGTSATSAADQFTYIAAPTISSVTAPADGTYRYSQNLDFTVNFSSAVTVTGTPTLSLTIGSTPRTATYVSGSGSTALVFRYTVLPLETDTDGIALTSPLALNGGTMVATSDSAAASLAFTPPNTSAVLVDPLMPSVSLITRAAGSTNSSANTGSGSPVTTLFPRGALSADGRYLVFSTTSSDLIAGGADANGKEDVYLADLVTGAFTLISHNEAATGSANDLSYGPSITPDGNWVTYFSAAADLVTGQTGGTANIILWKRATNTNYLVSSVASITEGESTAVTSGAVSVLPAAPVAVDGSFVYVIYRTSVLDSGQVNLYQVKFDLANPATRTRTLISHDAANSATAVGVNTSTATAAQTNGSGQPVMSNDGRYVAYLSSASTLVTGQTDTNNDTDLFLWDRTTNSSVLVSHVGASSVTSPTVSLSTTSGRPAFSADGAWLVWVSKANNIVTGQVDASTALDDCFLYEVATGTNILASRQAGSTVTAGGSTHAVVGQPSISTDGRYVTFLANTGANASYGLGLTVASGSITGYQFDRVAAAAAPSFYRLTPLFLNGTTPTSVTSTLAASPYAVVSTDGLVAIYPNNTASTEAGYTDSNGGGSSGGLDANLVVTTGVTRRIVTRSATTANTTGNATTPVFATNSDGSVVVAFSKASNLVSGFTDNNNGTGSLFLYRHARGTVDAVFSYTPPADGAITAASIAGTLPVGLAINNSTGVISGTPTAAGSSSVILTVTTSNGTVSWPLAVTIGKATLVVSVGNLAATYDASAKAVTASTTGPSLSAGSFSFTYAGSATAPTNAGTYAVVATINHANYQGVAYGSSLVISPAAVTVAGLSASNKTYDTNNTASLTGTASASGIASADAATATLTGTPTATFADKVVANGKTVSVTGYSLTGTAAANYSLTQPSFTANITAAPLTVTGVTASNKVYDRATTATLNTASAAPSGILGSDSVTLSSVGAAGTFADKTVANGKVVTTTGFSISGTDAANYSLTQPSPTANITAAPLTVTGVTASNKTYDGGTTATLTGTAALSGVISGDTVTLTNGSGAFASAAVGTAKPLTITGFTLGGGDAGNYSLTQPSASADITAKNLTISGHTAINKGYDGTNAAALTGTGSLVGVVPSDTANVTLSGTATATFADRHVANGKAVTVAGYSLTGSASTNYTLSQPTGLTANITAKALTISGVAAVATRVYDGTLAAGLTGTATFATAETTGTGNSGDGIPYTVDSISVGGTAAGAFADRHVGSTKAITVTGLTVAGTDGGNYTATQPIGLTGEVTAKALTVSGLTAVTTRVYDGTTVAGLTGTAIFLATEAAGAGTTLDGKPYDVDTINVGGTAAGAFADRHVGATKAITITGLTVAGTNNGNYTATQPTGLTAAVTAKALAVNGVTAVATRVYDGTNTAGLTGTAAFSATETAGTGATNDGKPYAGDVITIGGAAAGTFADRHVGTAKPITVVGVTVTGTDSSNYSVTQPTGLTANITTKALTIAGVTAAAKIYDATLTATLGGTAAFLTAESTSTGNSSDGTPYSVDTISVGGTAAGVFADKDVAVAKPITVTGLTVAGTDHGNYSATQPAGLTADITKKNLSISGVTASNKVYDGTTSVTLSGSPTLQAAEAPGEGTTADGKPYTGDTFSAAGTLSGTFADRHVGTGKTITVTGVSLSGAQSGNYNVGTVSTTADITPKALSVSGVAAVATRVYDATLVAGLTGTPALATAEATGTGTTLDGIPYTVDTIALGGTAAGAFADRHVGTAKGITVTGITVTGADNANYTVTQPTGLSGDVTAKALNVTGLAAVTTRVYDTTVTAGLTGTAAFLTAEAAGSGTTTDGAPYTGDAITIGGTAAGSFATKAVGTAKPVTVAGVTVTGTDSSNYSVTQPTGLTADVTAAGLTVTGVSGINKTYDGNLVATLSTAGASLVGILSTDTVNLSSGSVAGAFATKTIGTGKPVTVTGLALTGADAGNYSLTQPAATANITAKTITVGGITVANKIYDGNATGTATYTGAAFTGVVPGDTVTLVSSGGTATFNNKTVAAAKSVAFAGLTLAGADAANYTLTQPTTTADITAKNLTVVGITASSKSYDGNTAATLSTGAAGLVGVVSGDAVTPNVAGATGAFTNANAGLGKTVQVSGITLAGADSSNYSVTQPTTTATISPGGASVVISNLNFVYDGTPKSATVAVNPAVATSIVYSGGGGAPVNAGTYTVSVNVTDGNYSGGGTATLTIAKATQSMDFAIGGSDYKVGTSYGLTATSTSGGPITYSVVSGSASIAGSSVTPAAAGAITLRASQAGTDNYLPASVERSFTATSSAKLNQTITFASLSDVANDVGSFILGATASSGLPVSYTIISGPATLGAGSRLSLTGALGVVTVRASQAGNATYNPATDVLRSFVVVEPSPDIFFGDLTDDPNPGPDSRGELIQRSGPRPDAKTGDVAATVRPGSREGNILIAAPSIGLNVSVAFTLNADNTYTVSFTGAARPLTMTGSLNGTTLTGRIPALRVSFITTILAPVGVTSKIAGFYESDSLNSANGGTASVVGPNGQLLVVANTGNLSTGALGTVNPDGTFNVSAPGATINGLVDAPTTSVTGTIVVPGQTPVNFSGLAVTTARTDRLINLSSRVRIGPASNRTLITGFVIGGEAAKRVLLRAVGPTLTGFGVQGALSNPRLQLYDSTGKLILENDDWSGSETSAATAQVGAFSLVAGSKDAALVTTLQPGAYTMHVIDGGETGVALAEIYDASVNPQSEYQRLVNISSRGEAGAGENVLIGGFIITGNSPKKVLVRGIGPGLAAFGVAGTLVDPRLRVYGATGLIAENDNWSTVAAEATAVSDAGRETGAFTLANGSKDAAMILTLAPGAYTAQVGAADGVSTGVALVEIYEIPQQ